jgi:hypothetical protein
MSPGDQAPAPFSSWFGPIAWWRWAIFAAAGSAVHLALPLWLDAAQRRPVLLVAVLVGGAALGVLMGRHDARRALRPRRADRAGLPGAGAIVVGLSGAALILAQALTEAVVPYVPLVIAACGAAGITGARSRDRALADAVSRA